MFKNIIFAILIIFICIFMSCDSDSKFQNLDFLNTIWELQYFNNEGVIIKTPEDQIFTIQFETDSTFSGRSDCNDLFGRFELITNNNLNILQIFTTKVNCGNSSLDLDFFQAIESVKSYEISRDKLTILYGKNSKLIFCGQEL